MRKQALLFLQNNAFHGKRWIRHLVLLAAVFVIAAPVLCALIFSTQTPAQIFSYPPKLSFGSAAIDNYTMAWETYKLGLYMKNSLFIAVTVTLGKTLTAFLAATAFVYLRLPFRGFFFAFVLMTLMMPTEIMIIALFDRITDLGWADSYLALTIPFMASATSVFLFRQHFLQIPLELVDAARVDGIGLPSFMIRILLPMSRHVIAAMALIDFVYVWNQYLWPLVIIRDGSRQVVQVGLRMMTAGQDATHWGVVMAGAVITLVPPLLLFFILQKVLVLGVGLGQEK
ncbi:carbohydrate ABC transporter permease [Desulfobotulus sp. H1]|uniref:sn-glycerol-3-phosphate transport system permease protein UgpE n=1 Tax=Desulfobotulus pelophilus TaxID=2823377 RepID=A0ABT3N7U1_9BACT|nr:carbohydrate ABC transporter permease [Desulfobotulus pelophilus]MCW7753523.1 carbohydrate ABC transporter permease [Desulfobotulus pelophilus]